MNKVFRVTTSGYGLRCNIEGCSMVEDPTKYVHGKPVGLTPSETPPYYKTVLEALADGWTLMGPPIPYDNASAFDWWLTRPV